MFEHSTRRAAGVREGWRRFWRETGGPLWRDLEWPVVGALAAASMVLGYVGLAAQLSALQPGLYSALDILYLDLQLFVLQMASIDPPLHPALNVARFLAPAVAGYTALQALGALFAEQTQSLRLRTLRGHVVIGGLGRKSLILTQGFLERGQTVVIIEQDDENDLVRQCRDLGAVVLIGDASQEWLLRKAGVRRASHLFALCGDDGANADIAVQASRVTEGRSGEPLTCVVHVFDAQLCALLRERELEAAASGRLRLEFFNVFDLGARVLLEEHPVVSAGAGAGAAGRVPHVVIVGLGRLGECVLVHAARQWLASSPPAGGRMRVSLVDRRARAIADAWAVRYPALRRLCDLVPLDIDVNSAAFQQAAFLTAAPAGSDRASVFVCLDDDSIGLSAGLALADRARDQEPAIVVRMSQIAGLATLVTDGGVGRGFSRLRAFGLLDRTCQPDQMLRGTHEVLARGIHEEYVRQQSALGLTRDEHPELLPWGELSAALKDSNRRQADDIGNKLIAVGCGAAPLLDWDEPLVEFDEGEVERLARMEHERWMAEKRRNGWRHGPRKDPAAGTHPSLVPYDDLPAGEQLKNREAVRQIPPLLARLGFRVCRLRAGAS
jgi:hypothetical protein